MCFFMAKIIFEKSPVVLDKLVLKWYDTKDALVRSVKRFGMFFRAGEIYIKRSSSQFLLKNCHHSSVQSSRFSLYLNLILSF